jgi:hypothetical protein
VLLGIAGVVVLIGPTVLSELDLQLLAQIATLGAALSYALAGIFGRRFCALPPLVSAAGQVSVTAVVKLRAVQWLEAPCDRGLALRSSASESRRSMAGAPPAAPARAPTQHSHVLEPPRDRPDARTLSRQDRTRQAGFRVALPEASA